ncbi:transposase [bacterium]|nr:transposase [bacterium]MCP5462747.1 transposase [bacterium]
MPRKSRVVIPHHFHHVSQYGNYNQAIFDGHEDVVFYCETINRYAVSYGLQIYAFCLMNTHVHFLVIPPESGSLARTFNTAHMQYSQYRNRKHKIRGHLWQGRFLSCVIEQTFAERTMRYIERNPVRSGIVAYPWLYKWSSARAHTDKDTSPIHLHHLSFNQYSGEWKNFLMDEDEEICRELRIKTRRGLAIGSDAYIRQLEEYCKRSFVVLNPGRPRKKQEYQISAS